MVKKKKKKRVDMRVWFRPPYTGSMGMFGGAGAVNFVVVFVFGCGRGFGRDNKGFDKN